MNKNYFIILFFISFVRSAGLEVGLVAGHERLSAPDAVKAIAFWVGSTLACGTGNYFLTQKLPYASYSDNNTSSWTQWARQVGHNTKQSFKNVLPASVKAASDVLLEQVVKNTVNVCTRQHPIPISLSHELLLQNWLRRKMFGEHESANIYQYINNHFSSMALSTVFKPFVLQALSAYLMLRSQDNNECVEGLKIAQQLPFAMPASGKMFLLQFFLKQKIPLLKSIDWHLMINFEFAELIVKEWSGKHHLNTKSPISLNLLLLASWIAAGWYWNEKKVPSCIQAVSTFRLRTFPVSDAKKAEFLQAGSESIIEKFNDDTRLGQKKKYVIELHEDSSVKDALREKFECHKKRYQEEYQKNPEVQQKLFFWNIIALASGIFFHACLNTAFYWYRKYRTV